MGLLDIDDEIVGVVATTVWELDSYVSVDPKEPWKYTTVPLGNAEALDKKKLENCIILSSYILLDDYTL